MKKFVVAGLGAALVLSSIATPSQAVSSKAKVTKPSAPTVVSVTSSKVKKGKVNLTVTISLPTANGGSKITGSRVTAGGKSCTMKKLKATCTIKGIKNGKSVSVVARSKNKKGFGTKSATVKMAAGTSYSGSAGTAGSGEGAYSLAKGVKSSNTSLTRVLTTQSVKWNDFAAFSGATQAQGFLKGATNESVRTLGLGDITFATSGMIGLAKPASPGSGSGLISVDALGRGIEAVSSGTASIQNFYASPNGKFYVVFSTPVALVSGGTQCVFAEVPVSTGIPTCIDGTIESVAWSLGESKTSAPVQFDSAGSIYYAGSLAGKTVLRKYSAGTVSNLVNDNIEINDFLVLSDGTVIVSGKTTSTQASWIRKISSVGSLSTLVSGSQARFLKSFNDGNVYIGVSGGVSPMGVKRYITSSGILEEKYWINDFDGVPTYFRAGTVCSENGQTNATSWFCGSSGSTIKAAYSILGGKNFVVAGSQGSQSSSLMQYFPAVKRATSEVSNVTLSQNVITNILLAGTNAAGTNLLTIYDTSNGNETIVIDGTNEIEIYNMTYVVSTNKIMFNGLRFADNQFVVGEVSLG
jgi:hypothetical protein